MLPRWAVIGLAGLVSVMWAANLVVGFLYPGRNDPFLNYIFGMIVGAIFGIDRLARRRDNIDNPDGGDEPPGLPEPATPPEPPAPSGGGRP